MFVRDRAFACALLTGIRHPQTTNAKFASVIHSYKEESSTWAKRTIDVASATEDAGAINKVHDAVFGGKQVFAVDAPDGEHDLEDVVSAEHTIRSFMIHFNRLVVCTCLQ